MPYTEEQMKNLLRECKRDPLMSYNIDYWDRKNKNPYEWKVIYVGPKNTPYEGGIFTVRVTLNNYPEEQPKFYFITKIFHLNIYWLENKPDRDGHVCFGETSTNDIKELLKLVDTYFMFQNPDSTWYDSKVRQEYRDYRDGKSKVFYEKAQNWVYLYAGLNQLKK